MEKRLGGRKIITVGEGGGRSHTELKTVCDRTVPGMIFRSGEEKNHSMGEGGGRSHTELKIGGIFAWGKRLI